MKFPRHLLRPARVLRVLALAFLAIPFTGILEAPPFSSPEHVLVLDDSPSMRIRLGSGLDASTSPLGGRCELIERPLV